MQVSAQLKTLKNAFSLLGDRSIIKVTGRDAFKFLQGLTTNDLTLLQHNPSTSIYSNILNVQGRVAFDVLISSSPDSPSTINNSSPQPPPTSPEHTYLLDCSKNAAEDIQKYFDRYILRNKVKITDISNSYQVWSVFGRGVMHPPDAGATILAKGELNEWWNVRREGTLAMDPRFEKLGARMILPLSESPKLPTAFTEVNESVYNLYRLQWGIPQGTDELQKDVLLPLECNSELLNGRLQWGYHYDKLKQFPNFKIHNKLAKRI